MGLSFGLLCVTHPDAPIASERWLNKGDLLLSQAVHLWRKDPALARRLLEPLHSNLGREITWWLAEHPRCELELQDGNLDRHPLLPPLGLALADVDGSPERPVQHQCQDWERHEAHDYQSSELLWFHCDGEAPDPDAPAHPLGLPAWMARRFA